jgi:hypothetical protein
LNALRRVSSRWNPATGRPAVVALLLLVASRAAAQSPDRASGGHFRVPVPASTEPGIGLASSAGYGFTESQVDAPGGHHRMGGRLSAFLTPVHGLDFGLGTSLRHDRHSADDLGRDSGTAMSSDVAARAGWRQAPGLHLGIGAAATFPGGVSAVRSLAGPILDALFAAAYVPEREAWSLRLLGGFRWDRSGSAVAEAGAYRAGDRLALSVSEFNAMPLGVGVAHRSGATQWLAELSGELLLGSRAPSVLECPWRAAAGARHAVTDGFAVLWTTEVALSARPRLGNEEPLSPIEPRFTVAVGAIYTLAGWKRPVEPAAAPPPSASRPRPPAPLAAAPTASLEIRVTTEDGFPLSDAMVELQVGHTRQTVPHRELERYGVSGVPAGEATLRVSAPRLKPEVRRIVLPSGAPLVVEFRLEAGPVSGQIQGLVRAFGGQGLEAKIRIEPAGIELLTDAAGAFTVDVAPGTYEVVIEAPGHVGQRRRVQVGADGVVVLNADLSKLSR